MGKSDLTSIAAGTMSFVASVILIFVPEIGPDASWEVKLAATAGGTLSLYLLFALLRRSLLRWYYADLLGEWYYSTRPHDDVQFKDMNFALMTFKVDLEGDLSYEVDLYETLADLRSRTRQRRGHARSLALNYAVDQRCVELVFLAEYFTGRQDDVTRKGRLSLHFNPAGLLEGDYISEVWQGEGPRRQRAVSSGRMIAAPTIYDLEKAMAKSCGTGAREEDGGSAPAKAAMPPQEI